MFSLRFLALVFYLFYILPAIFESFTGRFILQKKNSQIKFAKLNFRLVFDLKSFIFFGIFFIFLEF